MMVWRTALKTAPILLMLAACCQAARCQDPRRIRPLPTLPLPGLGQIPIAPARQTQQYDAGDPTPEEQLVLESINRARHDPIAEGKRLGINIKEGLTARQQSLVKPRPPLAMNKILLSTARAHSADMYKNNYFAHKDKKGRGPAARIQAAGYQFIACGENIAGHTDPSLSRLQDMLMIDAGVRGRGHRVNLLDLNPSLSFREVGIGGYPNNSDMSAFLTQDFGSSQVGPFIVGVVYRDQNDNHAYDAGEGIEGITVSPGQGNYYAVTSRSGGFAFPCPAVTGQITITASGGELRAPISHTVSLAGTNVKADFVVWP